MVVQSCVFIFKMFVLVRISIFMSKNVMSCREQTVVFPQTCAPKLVEFAQTFPMTFA